MNRKRLTGSAALPLEQLLQAVSDLTPNHAGFALFDLTADEIAFTEEVTKCE